MSTSFISSCRVFQKQKGSLFKLCLSPQLLRVWTDSRRREGGGGVQVEGGGGGAGGGSEAADSDERRQSEQLRAKNSAEQ